MKDPESHKPSFKRLGAVQRKVISVTQQGLIKTGYLQSGDGLPLVVQPELADLNLATWAKGNQAFIEAQLLRHGAILFRGFPLASTLEFEQFALALCPELFGEYGDLPREGVSGKVYGSTPYPAEQVILFHNESSHLHRWPMRIWFFCVQAATRGGETPIVDCRQVYQRLNPKLRERFQQKKLMYVRNYTDGLDVSWQTFFRTTERSVVEAYCQSAGIHYNWKNGNGLRTRQVCPAVAQHPQTGEMVFFNQVQLHHVSCLDPSVRESLLAIFGEEDLPRQVYYGDGSPIEDSVMTEICELYRQTAKGFPWQEGDVLMLDNMLVAHGRNAYEGARKIVVALGEMKSLREIQG